MTQHRNTSTPENEYADPIRLCEQCRMFHRPSEPCPRLFYTMECPYRDEHGRPCVLINHHMGKHQIELPDIGTYQQ